MKTNKYLILASLLLAGIALVFWFSSRYPALNQKALMGGESPVEALGFDNTLEVSPNDTIPIKIIYNTINWVMTNRKGMVFGILFAAALMLLFAILYQRQFKNKFLNSVLGMFIGAPLGVCVNCAAPIAQGMRDAGARTETTLATMISSPTLNVIVMGMMFSLLPLYMVVIKLSLTILVILVVIPLIVHFLDSGRVSAPGLEKAEEVIKKTKSSALILSLTPIYTQNNWLGAFKWLIKSYRISLWHLVKVTVPLMLLAGLLGNILITLLPWQSIMAMIPPNAGMVVTIVTMIIIAIIGVFLPVPISFDVIIAAVLLAMGMQSNYVTVLLVTLGIFSIYSFFIVGQSISWKIAISLFISIAGLGVISGFTSNRLNKFFQQRMVSGFNTFSESVNEDVLISRISTYPAEALQNNKIAPPQPELIYENKNSGISINAIPFNPRNTSESTPFERIDVRKLGIPVEGGFSLNQMLEPFAQGKGIASEDFNNDKYPDLLLATEKGLELWANQEGFGFQKKDLPKSEEIQGFISNASLVDMNNDSWPDIVFTVYRKGYFIWYNQNGHFVLEQIQRLPTPNNLVSGTGLSIGDIDHDGDLDIAIGNWSAGWYMDVNNSYQASNDALLINDNGNFSLAKLPGIPGESLSTLISDFNNDGHQDIIVCNDYGVSDKYLLGDGKGNFRPLIKADSIIPYTTYFSMSTATADLDNDLVPEIYNTSISGTHLDMGYRSKNPSQICESIKDPELKAECQKVTRAYLEMSAYSLNSSLPCSEENELACIGYNLYWLGKRSTSLEKLRAFCEYIPESLKDLYFKNCKFDFELEPGAYQHLEEQVPPKRQTNTMLKNRGDGTFDEISDRMGVKYSGWSWNAKFADLNQDEYQDVMIVNGFVMNATQHSNLLYLNENGNSFKDATVFAGMTNFAPTGSYVYIDYDLDGDQDIFMAPKVGPALMYRNQMSGGNGIAFSLKDYKGNFHGISAKIVISYGDGKKQMREIQSGGGFRSSDGYTIYFGLATHTTVKEVEVIWSTGEKSVISTDLQSGHLYEIVRSHQKPVS